MNYFYERDPLQDAERLAAEADAQLVQESLYGGSASFELLMSAVSEGDKVCCRSMASLGKDAHELETRIMALLGEGVIVAFADTGLEVGEDDAQALAVAFAVQAYPEAQRNEARSRMARLEQKAGRPQKVPDSVILDISRELAADKTRSVRGVCLRRGISPATYTRRIAQLREEVAE
ncbi:MAG: recombinase family protein [Oscillospiraceae bacterium]|nr:recombinase family protein [Oscillospiraceae bacterium]